MDMLTIAPFTALTTMLGHPFMRHAFVAGTAVAVSAGLVGYFIVLRDQVFTGDALGHVAFTGALAALALGLDARVGLFGATVGVALLLGSLGHRGRADDVVIGSVFAWVLGLGVLFLSIFTTSHSTGNAAAGVRVLFGSIFGLDANQAWIAAGIGLAVSATLLIIARPLLFASLDEAVAAASAVPVHALGYVFLALVGFTAAESTQVVGALLLLGLLAAPAGAAQRLTARPYAGLALSVAIAVGSVWIGLTLSYFVGKSPPSFSILVVASTTYLVAGVGSSIAGRGRRSRRPHPARAQA